MVANSDINGKVAERADLIRDKVLPRDSLIGFEVQAETLARSVESDILVDLVDRPQIAEMPVEGRCKRGAVRGNRGHHDIPTVPRVARYDEPPRAFGQRRC
jgi:hypothetical protein